MIIVKKASELRKIISIKRTGAALAGFVPTMGALHKGHISLLDVSKNKTDFTVCSIFVNPAQFNNKEDFDNYPSTLENDIQLLENNGCDILFLPSADEIYPSKEYAQRKFDLGYLDTVLEGKFRPGHFQGVCNAVYRLLSLVNPDSLFLGQKDFQQCLVIKKMLQLENLEKSVRVFICPTIREANGLAMSSRNMLLSSNEIKKAGAIFQSLQMIKKNLRSGDLSALKEKAKAVLAQNDLKTDYIEIADTDNLQILESWDGNKKLVALAAAYMNKVRLIDNMLLN